MNKIREFTAQDTERYLKKHGLFPTDAKLDIKNIASGRDDTEGLVNLIYQVKDVYTGKSLIFKQVMPYVLALLKHEGVLRPTGKGRTITENYLYGGCKPSEKYEVSTGRFAAIS